MADETDHEFELPRRFGRYVLFDRIGRGGMADIYLARGTTQMGAARLAVVKLVLPHLAGDTGFASMLTSEAHLAARLSHANVVQTFDLGREENRLYIAMEYVEGYDLTQLLKRMRDRKIAMPAEYGFFVVMEMLRGLDYAHRCNGDDGASLGIVHRDVSPSNVLISLEGEVKLCDFGIARAVSDLSELPDGAMEGKAAYMSPEHARGERVDARADVFSATTILWEILSGRRMYRSQPDREVLDIAKAGEVPPLPDRGFPEYAALAAIVAKGLATSRDARYPTALALHDDLEDYVVRHKLTTSPMRFGAFLTEHFEDELVAVRRQREQAAIGLANRLAEPVEVMPVLPGGAPPVPTPAEPDDVPDLDTLNRQSVAYPALALPSLAIATIDTEVGAPSLLAAPAAAHVAPPVDAPVTAKRTPTVWITAAVLVVLVSVALAMALRG
jgi:serine/threonine-protein kinase